MDRHVVCGLLIAGLALGACQKKSPDSAPDPETPPARIITLTPSATELVVAVGAVDRLVATDQYSTEPEAVRQLPKVGDFLAPNVEAIAKLEPDLVIADDVQSKAAASLETLNIEVLAIQMHALSDIRRELVAVAAAVGEAEAGARVADSIEAAVRDARRRAKEREARPRVLWVMDRQPGALAEIVAAGPGSFAAELVELVGARNALVGSVRYPKLSREALIKIDPDVVIDASAAAESSVEAWRRGDRPWRAVAGSTDLATPGPGVGEAVKAVERLIFGS